MTLNKILGTVTVLYDLIIIVVVDSSSVENFVLSFSNFLWLQVLYSVSELKIIIINNSNIFNINQILFDYCVGTNNLCLSLLVKSSHHQTVISLALQEHLKTSLMLTFQPLNHFCCSFSYFTSFPITAADHLDFPCVRHTYTVPAKHSHSGH